MKFYGESYDAYRVTEYSRKFEKNQAFFCISECVLTYEKVKNKASNHRKNFEKSSEFGLFIGHKNVTSLTCGEFKDEVLV